MTKPAVDKKTSNIVKIVLSAFMAATLLWLSFKEIQWSDFAAGLSQCRWAYIVIGIALGAIALWLRAERWRSLLLPLDPKTSRLTAFNAICISYVVNMLIPRGGELLRGGIITRHSRESEGKKLASYDKVFGTVVIERVWDTLVLVIIAITVMTVSEGSWNSFLKDVFGNVRLSSSLTLPIMAAAGTALLASCYYMRNKISVAGKIWNFIHGIFSGARESLKMKRPWMFFLQTLAIWLCYWGTSYAVILALSDVSAGFSAMGPSDALFLMVAGSISSVVPVPGGFGAYHYLIGTSLMAVYGIPMEQGMVYAVLSHESQAIMQILLGGACYINETLRK